MKLPTRAQLTPREQILEFAGASADRVRIAATMEINRAQEVVDVFRKFLTDETAQAAFEECEGDVTGAYQIVTNWKTEPTASAPTKDSAAAQRSEASGQPKGLTNPAHDPYLEGLRQAALPNQEEWLRVLWSVGSDVAFAAYDAFNRRMTPTKYMVAKAAIDWLTHPSASLQGRVPLDVAQDKREGPGAVQFVLRRM